MNLDGDLDLAHRMADIADRVAMAHFPHVRTAHLKADGSPVSPADLAVQHALFSVLSDARPADAIVSEESPGRTGGRRRWIIDPIDGTTEFLAGLRGWGTHIALEVDGALKVAVLTRPAEGRRWWAVSGWGAYADGRRVALSESPSLTEARVAGLVQPGSPLPRAVSAVANWVTGLECPIGSLLDGQLDAVLDDNGEIWDHAPGALLVSEAGGVFLNAAGGTGIDVAGCLYATRPLAPSLLALLAATC
ncbi:inositol monophosphatase family protein [Streptomyces erythrochromogenes]|uniref:inositol monophosphatase family protein n=1 Tax=Streptomyces erythrochromogenes TaxID=285574 RepID=UPI003634F8DA